MKTIKITVCGEEPAEKAILNLTFNEFLDQIKNLTDDEADRFFEVCDEVAERRRRRSISMLRASDKLSELTALLSISLSRLSMLPRTREEELAEYPLNDSERAIEFDSCLLRLDSVKTSLKAIVALSSAYVNGDDNAILRLIRITEFEEDDEDDCEDMVDFIEDPDPLAA